VTAATTIPKTSTISSTSAVSLSTTTTLPSLLPTASFKNLRPYCISNSSTQNHKEYTRYSLRLTEDDIEDISVQVKKVQDLRGSVDQMLANIEECARTMVTTSRTSPEEMMRNDDDDMCSALQEMQQMTTTTTADHRTLQVMTALRIAKEYDKITAEMFSSEEPQRTASAFRLVSVCLAGGLFSLAFKYALRGLNALLSTTGDIPIEIILSCFYLLAVVCERTNRLIFAEHIYKQILRVLEELHDSSDDVNSASPLESELHRRLIALYTVAHTRIQSSITPLPSSSQQSSFSDIVNLPYNSEQLQHLITLHQQRFQLLKVVFPTAIDDLAQMGRFLAFRDLSGLTYSYQSFAYEFDFACPSFS
jgi:hypothetical protein